MGALLVKPALRQLSRTVRVPAATLCAFAVKSRIEPRLEIEFKGRCVNSAGRRGCSAGECVGALPTAVLPE
jgi:hypothetical protein